MKTALKYLAFGVAALLVVLASAALVEYHLATNGIFWQGTIYHAPPGHQYVVIVRVDKDKFRQVETPQFMLDSRGLLHIIDKNGTRRMVTSMPFMAEVDTELKSESRSKE